MPTKQWKPALLRWKRRLPPYARTWLERNWLWRAGLLMDSSERQMRRARDYTDAARLIAEPTDKLKGDDDGKA